MTSRGGWCPYCNAQLRGLQQVLPRIRELGGSPVAVSPQSPDSSLTMAEKNALASEVLSDCFVASDNGRSDRHRPIRACER
jgi:peroxiredoxin